MLQFVGLAWLAQLFLAAPSHPVLAHREKKSKKNVFHIN